MTKAPSPIVDEAVEAGAEAMWRHEVHDIPAGKRARDGMKFTDLVATDQDDYRSFARAVLEAAAIASPPKAGAGEPVTELEGLIDAYWGLAFNEGRENRTTDTPDGDAQRVRSAITARLKALANHETRRDGLRVTDEMVERARRAILKCRFYDPEPHMYDGETAFFAHIETTDHWPEAEDEARDALEAALAYHAPALGETQPGLGSIAETRAFPKTLGLIHQAIDSYVNAIVAREHGGLAENRAFVAICAALGRSPTQEMDARRRALSNHGGGL